MSKSSEGFNETSPLKGIAHRSFDLGKGAREKLSIEAAGNAKELSPLETQEMRTLSALGLDMFVIEKIPADTQRDAQKSFSKQADAIADLSRDERTALKTLGDNFVSGNWTGFAKAVSDLKALSEEEQEKVLGSFGRVVADTLKDTHLAITGDGDRGYILSFKGNSVRNGSANLTFSSQDGRVTLATIKGVVLNPAMPENAETIWAFEKTVRDQFAARMTDKHSQSYPAGPGAEKNPLKAVQDAQLKAMRAIIIGGSGLQDSLADLDPALKIIQNAKKSTPRIEPEK